MIDHFRLNPDSQAHAQAGHFLAQWLPSIGKEFPRDGPLAQAGADSQVMLRMDGQAISSLLGPDGSFALSQLDRGDHTLTLQVTDAQGDVTCQANAVTFTIRQRSVIPPSAPTAPTAPGVARHTGP